MFSIFTNNLNTCTESELTFWENERVKLREGQREFIKFPDNKVYKLDPVNYQKIRGTIKSTSKSANDYSEVDKKCSLNRGDAETTEPIASPWFTPIKNVNSPNSVPSNEQSVPSPERSFGFRSFFKKSEPAAVNAPLSKLDVYETKIHPEQSFSRSMDSQQPTRKKVKGFSWSMDKENTSFNANSQDNADNLDEEKAEKEKTSVWPWSNKDKKTSIEDQPDRNFSKQKVNLTNISSKILSNGVSAWTQLSCFITLLAFFGAANYFVMLLYFSCNAQNCSFCIDKNVVPLELSQYVDFNAFLFVIGWICFQFAIAAIPIGKVVRITNPYTGKRITSRINGMECLFITLLAMFIIVYLQLDLLYVYDRLPQMIFASSAIATVLSFLSYNHSHFSDKKHTSQYSKKGIFALDFFFGREVNPTIFGFDIKRFMVMRPGFIAWAMIDLFLISHHIRHHPNISIQLLLISFFHLLYVFELYILEEEAMSSHWYLSEGFGFLHIWGSLVWIPFVFSIHARFLFEYGAVNHLGGFQMSLIFLINMVGFYLLYLSTRQKALFKKRPDHPKVNHLQCIGEKKNYATLLVGGLWSQVRHPNYAADLLMALSWSIVCGQEFLIPYVYFGYLFTMHLLRIYFIEKSMSVKYGAKWTGYCEKVPYRLIPGFY